MHFTKTIFALTFAGVPIYALPVDDNAAEGQFHQSRDTTVTCTPKKNDSNMKSFKVSMDYATNQVTKAGFAKGKSGDPHNYGNVDNIQWGVKGCNTKNAQLWECK